MKTTAELPKCSTRVGDALVIIRNSTEYEPDAQTLRKIAENAASAPIYWSDDRMRHWIFDQPVDGWWYEATRIDLIENVMELNVYQDPGCWDRIRSAKND